MGSKRFLGKMMVEIAGEPLLKLIFDRLKRSKELNKIILATSTKKENDVLEKLSVRESVDCYRGSEDDVLDRFYQISQKEADFRFIVRVCGDNPLIDPLEVDRLVKFHQRGEYDYSYNHIPDQSNGYPDGVGAEILSRELLKYIWENTHKAHQREHCFDYVWDNISQFKIGILKARKSIRRPDVKLDVDTQEDLNFIRDLLDRLSYDRIVRLNTEEIIRIYDEKSLCSR